jgi:hypothetical protein
MTMAYSGVDPDSPQSAHLSENRRAEFEALSRELAENELALATLESGLSAFEKRYAGTIGLLLAEVDELEKAIANELLRKHPTEDYRKGSERADKKAKISRDAVNERIQDHKKPFTPSDELRNLYRKVAKAIHPDLASDSTERAYRTSLMARANEAYKNGNLEALEQILDEWDHRSARELSTQVPSSEYGQFEQIMLNIRARISEIRRKTSELQKSELYQLMIKVERAELEGRDLLGEMAENLHGQIQAARGLLESLREKD